MSEGVWVIGVLSTKNQYPYPTTRILLFRPFYTIAAAMVQIQQFTFLRLSK